MSIIRSPRPASNFVIISKRLSECKPLSWAARGLMLYLLGKPDNWKISVQHLMNEATGWGTGRDAIYRMIDELIQQKYIRREKIQGDYVYTVFDTPFQDTETQDTPFQDTETPTQTSNDLKQELNEPKKEKNAREAVAQQTGPGDVAQHADDLPQYAKVETRGPYEAYAMYADWKPEPLSWDSNLKAAFHKVKPEQFTDYTLAEFVFRNKDGQDKTEQKWQQYYINAVAQGMFNKPAPNQHSGNRGYGQPAESPEKPVKLFDPASTGIKGELMNGNISEEEKARRRKVSDDAKRAAGLI